MIKVACAQIDVSFGEPTKNAEKIVASLMSLADEGVDLAVFPEAATAGYCASNHQEAEHLASIGDLPCLDPVQEICDAKDIVAVVGFTGWGGNQLFNRAALFEKGLPVRTYSKVHLPILGYDRFATPGNDLPVFETRVGRLGILVCFDMRIPEAARTLVLKGADIVVLPTNWPVGAEISANYITVARAAESRVFVVACNRVGEERGSRFIGQSSIIDVVGKKLAVASDCEELLIAEINPLDARQKRTVNIPGEYELEILATRRPELYRVLTQP